MSPTLVEQDPMYAKRPIDENGRLYYGWPNDPITPATSPSRREAYGAPTPRFAQDCQIARLC